MSRNVTNVTILHIEIVLLPFEDQLQKNISCIQYSWFITYKKQK